MRLNPKVERKKIANHVKDFFFPLKNTEIIEGILILEKNVTGTNVATGLGVSQDVGDQVRGCER